MAQPQDLGIGFVGLGAMGYGMASHLVKSKFRVIGFDVSQAAMQQFHNAAGGRLAKSPKEAAESNNFLVCMVATAYQVDAVLFGRDTGVVHSLPRNAVILLCSTVPAAFVQRLQLRLDRVGRNDILLVDCPVSGGTKWAAEGKLTILASGIPSALDRADPLLRCMSEKLYSIPGGLGAASNVKMVNQLLVGVHIAAASEAMGLAAQAGLNTQEVYNIITQAAGNSWAFENRVPHMLSNDWTAHSALDIFVKDLGIVTSTGRSVGFPLPLASAAEQLYIAGSSRGYGKDDDAGLVRVFLPSSPSAVKENARSLFGEANLTPTSTPIEVHKIGFIGLGAMGSGMASSLVRTGFKVQGFDVRQSAVQNFVKEGEKAGAATSPTEAVADAQVVVLMVQNASQVEDILFGTGNAAEVLVDGAVVILSSTVPPSFTRSVGQRLSDLRRNISLIDAPVSGGVVRAAKGDLTIICAGDNPTISRVSPVLSAMTGPAKNLCYVQGGVGTASSVKLINQLLAGVHIATAAEAMAFGAKLGLDTRMLFDILSNAAGWSWMLENRVPAMLAADWTPNSALAIFVKDLGIVLDEAKRLLYSAPMSAAAHILYLAGASHGWANDADSGVVRFWQLLTGASVSHSALTSSAPATTSMSFEPRQYPTLSVTQALDSLEAERTEDTISNIREHVNHGDAPVLIVLDDDPTGTQTCRDINVLTVWDNDTLCEEFRSNSKGFFILTNSRALPPTEAKQLIKTITENVTTAAKACGKAFDVVLRGDSTLRGHLPEEPEAVEEVLGSFDGWVIAPFFLQGGRYTIDDVHYVKEGDTMVPASQTPFAADASFGYKSSNLRDYIVEKCGTRFSPSTIDSITLDDVRNGGPSAVTSKLLQIPKGSAIIVNAAAESDMFVFVAGLLGAEAHDRRYLFRTGAAFVSARLGLTSIPPLTMKDLNISSTPLQPIQTGGLIIAGSYVPKTTAQLRALRARLGDKLETVALDVHALITSPTTAEATLHSAARVATSALASGRDTLVVTSRTQITGSNGLASLAINSTIAKDLVRILDEIDVRPRYVIAKGGITASDAATKGLRMRRARVLGQAAQGVPLWRCEEETSRWCGVPFVVFPGNVGGEESLADVVEGWSL